jgi:type II secretory pathway component PulK
MVERGLKAEYLLKSAVNFARALIQYDESPVIDAKQDIWADKILPFSSGARIPAELLQISDPGVSVEIEIRPVDATIPLPEVITNTKWQGVLARLFQRLGFDDDGIEDHTGLMPGRVFGSEDMVAALIDYIDKDEKSFTSNDFGGTGIESQLGENSPFRNDGNIERATELSVVPGFAPERLRKLLPFVRTESGAGSNLNINFAPEAILSSLHEDLAEGHVAAIIAFRDGEDGPFGERHSTVTPDLNELIGDENAQLISWALRIDSRKFQVIAKVELGGTLYFMRAILTQQGNLEPPRINSVEIY